MNNREPQSRPPEIQNELWQLVDCGVMEWEVPEKGFGMTFRLTNEMAELSLIKFLEHVESKGVLRTLVNLVEYLDNSREV